MDGTTGNANCISALRADVCYSASRDRKLRSGQLTDRLSTTTSATVTSACARRRACRFAMQRLAASLALLYVFMHTMELLLDNKSMMHTL